jgi:hypothetical protein
MRQTMRKTMVTLTLIGHWILNNVDLRCILQRNCLYGGIS